MEKKNKWNLLTALDYEPPMSFNRSKNHGFELKTAAYRPDSTAYDLHINLRPPNYAL